jgi:hypothetical protein
MSVKKREPDPAEMREAHLNHIAREVKRLYVQEKAKRIPNFKMTSRNDVAAFFQAAAEIVLSEQISPEVFIEAVFQNCSMHDGPFANALGGKAARAWVAEYRADRQALARSVTDAAAEVGMPVPDVANPNDMTALPTETWLRIFIQQTVRNVTQVHRLDPLSHEARMLYRRYTYSMHPVVRVLFGYPDQQVFDICGEEVRNLLRSDPSWCQAIRNLNYPLEQILPWLEQS